MATFNRPTTMLLTSFRRYLQYSGVSRPSTSWSHRTLNKKISTCPFQSIRVKFRKFGAYTGLTVGGTSLAFFGFSFKKEDLSEADQIRQLVSEGIVKKEKHDIEGASKAFHNALQLSAEFLAEKKISETDSQNHKVFIYDQIANMSLDMGQFKNAEELFKETMRLALRLGMEQNDNAIIEMSLKLAMIYLYTGRKELAHHGLEHCITEQERKIKVMEENKLESKEPTKPMSDEDMKKAKELESNTKILLGKAYKNYANSYLQSRDFKRAEPLIIKSLDISKKEMGPHHDTTFVIMNDLATCKIMLKDYKNAEDMLLEAIKNSKKENSVMESALASNLGALYIRTGRYEEAETICTRGLAIAEKFKDQYFMGPCKACLAKLQEVKDMQKENSKD